MFGMKRIAELEGKISELYNQLGELKRGVVTCETCGCAVLKENARRGQSKIAGGCYGLSDYWESARVKEKRMLKWVDEYIYTPYYCKGCYADSFKTKTCRKKKGEKSK